MSASNAALSDTPQEGADDLLWEAHRSAALPLPLLVPEPGSMALVTLGLLGAGAARRRQAGGKRGLADRAAKLPSTPAAPAQACGSAG